MPYNRILLKISGEALAKPEGFGLCHDKLQQFCSEIYELHQKKIVQVAIVVGGGNIHRGISVDGSKMDRVTSDYMGMLATVINALAIQDVLEKMGASTRVMSAIEMRQIAEPYIKRKAVRHLEKGRIVIFAAGTGSPYFSTDTTAALRANEIGAQVVLKATKVDGVYSSDPVKNATATKFDILSYEEVLQRDLKVMDTSAIALCKENGVDIIVFDIFTTGNMIKAVLGNTLGTLISSKSKKERE